MEKPYHYMDPNGTPKYHVPCGEGDKVFSEGHGGSVYPGEVTCEKCKKHLIERGFLERKEQ